MSYTAAGRPSAIEIRLKSAEKTLEIDFENGVRCSFPAEFLRVESPSAEVKGHGPDQRVTVPGRRHVAITGIDPVGNYAVRLHFDDLHDTGLYSWRWLYELGQGQEAKWRAYLDALAARGLSRER